MIGQRVSELRKLMIAKGLDVVIIPTADQHQSEYIPDYWKCRAWISGFTGSYGTVVITQNHAGLWTDSRYFIQAEKELGSPFVLHRLETRDPEYLPWIVENNREGAVVGFDGQLISVSLAHMAKTAFVKKSIEIVDTGDLFTEIWLERPSLPKDLAFEHDTLFCGDSRAKKLSAAQGYLKFNDADALLVSVLDEIAWLLNIRGNDIAYNPVLTAHFLVLQNKTLLFTEPYKIPEGLKEKLQNDKVEVLEYRLIADTLQKLERNSVLLCNTAGMNYRVQQAIPTHCVVKSDNQWVSRQKAIKNSVEIESYKQAQAKDGVAMSAFLYWLEQNVDSETLTEWQVAQKLLEIRHKQPGLISASFESISAYGANAALPHYSCSEKTASVIKAKGLYLIDSGGQYPGGTTDITRTVAVGELSNEEKLDYTLVLKGHIAMAMARFPKGTRGYQLDALARTALWQYGKNYGHGTGHGIGLFLNVHEGPQGLSPLASGPGNTILEAGMLVTNEPGMYVEGSHGIRIENVLLIKDDEQFPGYLKFETVTYCPIDLKPVLWELMEPKEVAWINDYHEMVRKKVAKNCCQMVKEWVEIKTTKH